MICIITGDIIGSRKLKEAWLPGLKLALEHVSIKNKWEIYRGDSFQLEVKPDEAVKTAIYLKACIKSNKNADVRMGIGIGLGKIKNTKITETTDEAFVLSGAALDGLKQNKVNLSINTNWPDFDEEINVLFQLALIAMDNWGLVAAEMVKLALENPGTLQAELALISGRTQSSVSEALKRARFAELMDMDLLYRKKINHFMQL